MFADLADVRLDKRYLSAPIDRNEEPDAVGSFGMVVKRFFHEVMKEKRRMCCICHHSSVSLVVSSSVVSIPCKEGSIAAHLVICHGAQQADRGETEVAVKIFDRYDDTSLDSSTELTKNYSDMRYELNKLSSLHHPHIVRFIGVFTNPHCFVLEWAPQKTLEHIRQNHEEKSISICTTSIFLVLLQVGPWYMTMS